MRLAERGTGHQWAPAAYHHRGDPRGHPASGLFPTRTLTLSLMTLAPWRGLALVAAATAALAPAPGFAQATFELPGVVLDQGTGRGVAGVLLRVRGTEVTAVTDDDGNFVLRGIPVGRWTLLVQHVAYGEHDHPVDLDPALAPELVIRMTPQAIELEALVVEAVASRTRSDRAQGNTSHVVERAQIERVMGSSRHLGDVIRQSVPGIALRQPNNLEGTDVCLEFRAAGTVSLQRRAGCNHPLVLLDGVPVGNPNYLYGIVGLQNLERIEVIPPGAAGARYGTGSLFGVILLETRPPGAEGRGARRVPVVPVDLRRRVAFDWSRDPAGHDLLGASAGAFLGNAAGLAAGVAVGRHCIGVSEHHEIVTRCGFPGDVAAALAAMALPALGSAMGARIGGGNPGSRGRLGPALLSAALMVFPGYAFSMATVGGGSHAANVAGAVMLVAGTPLFVTLADRMFRDVR